MFIFMPMFMFMFIVTKLQYASQLVKLKSHQILKLFILDNWGGGGYSFGTQVWIPVLEFSIFDNVVIKLLIHYHYQQLFNHWILLLF
jgi:hypothetical protein